MQQPCKSLFESGRFLMAKAKISKAAAAKKASKPKAVSVPPVKEILTKSALINHLAEQNDIPRKTAAAVYATCSERPRGRSLLSAKNALRPRSTARFAVANPNMLYPQLRPNSYRDDGECF